MTQPTRPKFLDINNVGLIGDQQTAITAITDSTGGVVTDTVNYAVSGADDDIATLAAKINEIIEVLEAHGLIEDN